ncbi:glutaredoxin family protein [Microbulbifer harenosus]|uniref:Glutaredoxin family protein n=1 Tax=Microbulbifer harenosus TaxID=2576840 RepID=A0ABY2UKH2_9GAMM|nr:MULTISPECIES: glutaredoxin family protein [Microbulbifer]QIL91816.1 glutaredoxin family protein [Microbulbifer sp. SH-1]TLM78774.1 glutaredoxin family protein [Microbulbifer harenosus]
MSQRALFFYTTLGCSLCEKAKPEIWPLLEKFDLRLQPVDIADDEELTRLFGWSIPVVGLGEVEDVLCWPFTTSELASWLSARLS